MKYYISVLSIFMLSACATIDAADCLLGTCQERLDASQRRLGEERTRGATLREERDATLAQRDATQQELRDAEAAYDSMQRDLTALKARLKQAGEERSGLARELEALEDEIALHQAAAHDGSDDMQQELEQLERRKGNLERQIKQVLQP